MAAQAAHLVDCVLPAVPLRQFVLSFPFALFRLAEMKPDVLRALARIHAEELARHNKRTAKPRAETSLIALIGAELHTGAVTFVQRFGSSLNLHVHVYTYTLDGLYIEPHANTTTEGDAALRFLPATPPTHAELRVLLERIARRVMIWLRKRGYVSPNDASSSNDSPNLSFAELLSNIGTQRGTVETRLCALVPPPRNLLTRFHGVIAPRTTLRRRVVPKLPTPPERSARATLRTSRMTRSRSASTKSASAKKVRRLAIEAAPVIPDALPVSATLLARHIDHALARHIDRALARHTDRAEIPASNVLSATHLDRIHGGLLFAATSNVPWALLLARTFDVDSKACPRCEGRLVVRAVITDLAVAREILDSLAKNARAPPRHEDDAQHAVLVLDHDYA
jgi:hypothetical protein